MQAGNCEISKKRREDILQMLHTWRGPGLPLPAALAQMIGLTSASSVSKYLIEMEHDALIERSSLGQGLPKIARLTEKGRAAIGVSLSSEPAAAPPQGLDSGMRFNLQAFPISCGALKECVAEPQYITSLSELFRNYRDGDYLLFCEGDSMVAPVASPECIYPGDRVLVRPSIASAPGDIVHAEFVNEDGGHEATLKVFQIENAKRNSNQLLVRLKSLNPEYPDIVRAADQIEVHGVVLEVLHLIGAARK